jgi:Protein of unknown function (DUF4254)
MQNASLGLLPSAFEMSSVLREMIERWHQINPPLAWETAQLSFPEDLSTLKGEIQQLGLINCFQWHLEDECRAHYSWPAILANLKRDIDLSNQRRVCMIDVIDEEILRVLCMQDREADNACVALTTPGNLMDRLSILELKRYHAQGMDSSKLALTKVKLDLIEEQITDLCTGTDNLIRDLLAGRQSLKVYRTIKLYG